MKHQIEEERKVAVAAAVVVAEEEGLGVGVALIHLLICLVGVVVGVLLLTVVWEMGLVTRKEGVGEEPQRILVKVVKVVLVLVVLLGSGWAEQDAVVELYLL